MAHEPPVNTAEDRLGWMIRRQREFQEDILGHGSLADMTPRQRAEYFRVQSLALVFELGEASNEIGWKPWATTEHFNRDAYLSEAIDVIHFAINLALAGGATDEQIFQVFVTKNEKNRTRQRDGYDGVSGKCPGCSRSYDDLGVVCTPATPCACGETRVRKDGLLAWAGPHQEHHNGCTGDARGVYCAVMYPRNPA